MGDLYASEDGGAGFAKRLRELRRAKGFSQTDLGKLVGLHYTHIGRYERGTAKPSGTALKRLADALDVSADYLFEGTTHAAARADFEDRELLRMFKDIEAMSADEKLFVKKVLDALVTKKKVQQLAQPVNA